MKVNEQSVPHRHKASAETIVSFR